MSSDQRYLIGGAIGIAVVIFLYRQHQKSVIEKIKQQELASASAPASQQGPQVVYPAPILINAPASMFKVPVDRNNAVILPVNIPAGYSPAVI